MSRVDPPPPRVPLGAVDREAPRAQIAALKEELSACSDAHHRAMLAYEIGCRLEQDLGDLDSALKQYQAAHEMDRRLEAQLLALIRIGERAHDFGRLQRWYAALEEQATTPARRCSAMLDRGALAEDYLSRPAEARGHFERALKETPSSIAASLMLERHLWHAGEQQAAIPVIALRALHAADPVLMRLLFLEAAEEAAKAGDVDGAFRFLRGTASVEVERWRQMSLMARLARLHGRWDIVHEALVGLADMAERRARGDEILAGATATILQPFAHELAAREKAAALWWEICHLRATHLGDPTQAAEAIERAATLLPNDELLQLERLDRYDAIGDTAKARTVASQLLRRAEVGPHLSALHYRVAAGVPEGHQDGIRAALEAALRADPNSVAAHALLDSLLMRGGHIQQRATWLESRAAKLGGRDASRLFWQAAQTVADSGGNLQSSRKPYEAALAHADDPAAILREIHGALWLRTSPTLEGTAAAQAYGSLDDVAERLILATVDPDERDALHHEQYRHMRFALGEVEAATDILRLLLDEPSPPIWCPEVARITAARTADMALLAMAHRRLAELAADPAQQSAHLCAASRALSRGGEIVRAEETLREVLALHPHHRYARALLEEVIRSNGEVLPVIALLREGALDTANDREAEIMLLRAAAAAEDADLEEMAVDIYREAMARNPSSVAAAWSLRRLAAVGDDRALRLQALESLAQREAARGRPGLAAFELGEHYDLLTDHGDEAAEWLRTALTDENVGMAAAVTLLLSPRASHVHAEALERLLGDMRGRGTTELQRALCGVVVDAGEGAERVAQLIAAVLQSSPRDRWVRFAALRLLAADREDAGPRAVALEALSKTVEDGTVRGELLLLAKWAAAMDEHPADAGIEGRLYDAIVSTVPESLLAAVAEPRSSRDGSLTARPDTLLARLNHTSSTCRPTLEAAYARALLFEERCAEAKPLLEAIVQREPGDLASWEALLHVARSMSEAALVARTADHLASQCGTEFKAYLLEESGVALLQLGRSAEGIVRLRAAFTADPRRTEAYRHLHHHLETANDIEALLTLITARIQVIDEPAELIELLHEQARLRGALGQVDGAVESVKNLRVLTEDHAGGLAVLAHSHVQAGRFADAVEALRSLAEAESSTPDQRRTARLAAAQYLSERLHDDAAAYAELAALDADDLIDDAIRMRMLDLAEHGGLFVEAAQLLESLAADAEDHERAAFERRLGELCAGPLDRRVDAIAAYRRALDIVPTDLATAESLAHLLESDQRRSLAAAYEAAVWNEADHDASDPGALRKLRRAATWNGNRKYEADLLLALHLLGHSTAEEAEYVENLMALRPPPPHGLLSEGSVALLAPAALDPLLFELLDVGKRALADAVDLSLTAIGCHRRNLIAADDPRPWVRMIIATCRLFGIASPIIYLHGDDDLLVAFRGDDDRPTWVVGSEIENIWEGSDGGGVTRSTAYRIAEQAFALRLGASALVGRNGAEAAALMHALAAAAGGELPGSEGLHVDDLAQVIAAAMSRTARKTAAAILASDRPGSPEQFALEILQSVRRAGLLVSGDLAAALEAILDRPPSAMAIRGSAPAIQLLQLYLSQQFRDLVADIGVAPESPARPPVDLSIEHLSAYERAAARLERTASYTGQEVTRQTSIESLLAPPPGSLPPPDTKETSVVALDRSGPEGLQARADLLLQLAKRSRGPVRARLLVSAGEVVDRMGHRRPAERLFIAARRIDPEDLLALRAVRRAAALRGAHHEVAEYLEAETQLPMGRDERAFGLLLLSQVKLLELGDVQGGIEAGRQALAMRPSSPVIALTLAFAQLMADRMPEALASLERAANGWPDPAGQNALFLEVARGMERVGDHRRARMLYKQVAAAEGDPLDALLGLARNARQLGGSEEMSSALQRASSLVQTSLLKETFLLVAARHAHLVAKRPALAAEILADAREIPALEARAEAAHAADDRSTLRAALKAWANATKRTAKAFAHILLAETLADDGDWEGAHASLREAARADGTLATVHIVREGLARRAGDIRRMARSAGSEGAGLLAAAARTAPYPEAEDLERLLLSHAMKGHGGSDPSRASIPPLRSVPPGGPLSQTKAPEQATDDATEPPTTEVGQTELATGDEAIVREIALDAAAQAGDHVAVEAGLRARTLTVGTAAAASVALARTELLVSLKRVAEAQAVLEEVAEAVGSAESESEGGTDQDADAPDHPSAATVVDMAAASGDGPRVAALRWLADLHPSRQGVEAARWWLRESQVTDGTRSAFASTMAGRILLEAGEATEGWSLLKAANDKVPYYLPALFAAENAWARAMSSKSGAAHRDMATDALVSLRLAFAETAPTPSEQAALLIGAALAKVAPDMELMVAAHAKLPNDAVLTEMLLGLPLDADQRIELLSRGAAAAPDASVRSVGLRAAFALLDRGRANEAKQLCARVSGAVEETDALTRHLLDLCDTVSGDLEGRVARLRDEVRQAPSNASRALALELLATAEIEASGNIEAATRWLYAILELFPGHMATLRRLERLAMESRNDVMLADIESRFVTLNLSQAEANARLGARLMVKLSNGDPAEADKLLCAAFDHVVVDQWLARRVESAARSSRDLRLLSQALAELGREMTEPLDQISIELRSAQVLAELRSPSAAAQHLAHALAKAPSHPTAQNDLARLWAQAGSPIEAAEAFEQAATIARAARRATELWYRAGKEWEERAGDPQRAAKAYGQAAKLDIGFLDLLKRLLRLLKQSGDVEKLLALVSARIRKGGDRDELKQLHVTASELQQQMGDLPAAKRSLRAAVSLAPDSLEMLERLARTCQADEDWRGALDALQRMGRSTNDARTLRNVFMQLGHVYVKLNDATRAEASYKKVLSLFPSDATARERLAALQLRR